MRKSVQGRITFAALAGAIFIALATAAEAASPAPAVAATPPPQPAQIDRNSVLILIRTAIVDLQQANQTNNYNVLYSLSAPGFQSRNSPERLSQIFANLRAKNFDLSGVVVLEPQLSVLPELYSNGVMRMAGFFPSVPMQVYFDLQFMAVQGQWRLIAIGVNIGSPVSAAPVADVPRRAQPVAEAQSGKSQSAAPIVETGRAEKAPSAAPTP